VIFECPINEEVKKMKKEEKGISRRRFLTGSAAIALSGLLTKKVFSQAKDSPPLKTGT
jgi:hypothetical protein